MACRKDDSQEEMEVRCDQTEFRWEDCDGFAPPPNKYADKPNPASDNTVEKPVSTENIAGKTNPAGKEKRKSVRPESRDRSANKVSDNTRSRRDKRGRYETKPDRSREPRHTVRDMDHGRRTRSSTQRPSHSETIRNSFGTPVFTRNYYGRPRPDSPPPKHKPQDNYTPSRHRAQQQPKAVPKEVRTTAEKFQASEKFLKTINFEEENHYCFADQDIPEDIQQFAKTIKIISTPEQSAEDMSQKIIQLINENDGKPTFISIAIFDKTFDNIGKIGVENMANKISHHVSADKSKSNIKLSFCTLPYHPYREHKWKETEELNYVLILLSLKLGSPPFKLHRWLLRPVKGNMSQRQCKGCLYVEFNKGAKTREEEGTNKLGKTLERDGIIHLVDGLIRHHANFGVRDHGGLDNKEPMPIPLNETKGYKLSERPNPNDFLVRPMGFMDGLIRLENKERKNQLTLTVNNDKVKTDETEVVEGAKQVHQPQKFQLPVQDKDSQNTPPRSVTDNGEKKKSKKTTEDSSSSEDEDSEDEDSEASTQSEDDSPSTRKIKALKCSNKLLKHESKLLETIYKQTEQKVRKLTKQKKQAEINNKEELKRYEDQYDRDQKKIKDLLKSQEEQVGFLETRLQTGKDEIERLTTKNKELAKEIKIKDDTITTLKKGISQKLKENNQRK
jgi:hypothetical protein